LGNSLSSVFSNIFVEHFEEIPQDTEEHKPANWLRYVDETFMVLPHGSVRLQKFRYHLSSVRPAMEFTMEVEANDILPFLDILAMERGPKLATKVCQKPNHTGRYLHFKSKQPHHAKRGVVQ
jgi:hypothetical protein